VSLEYGARALDFGTGAGAVMWIPAMLGWSQLFLQKSFLREIGECVLSTGRCAGCGMRGDASLLQEHVRYCGQYAVLNAEHPDRAIDPEAEFIRWRAAERSGERAAWRRAITDEACRRQAVQAERWATPVDILEDL